MTFHISGGFPEKVMGRRFPMVLDFNFWGHNEDKIVDKLGGSAWKVKHGTSMP